METGVMLILILSSGVVLYLTLVLAWCTVERLKKIEARQYQIQMMKFHDGTQAASSDFYARGGSDTAC